MTLPADPTVLKITLPNVLGSCSPREGGSEACGGLVVEASATASDPRSCAWLRFPPPCLPVAQQSWGEAVPTRLDTSPHLRKVKSDTGDLLASLGSRPGETENVMSTSPSSLTQEVSGRSRRLRCPQPGPCQEVQSRVPSRGTAGLLSHSSPIRLSFATRCSSIGTDLHWQGEGTKNTQNRPRGT